jgi:D-alanyl-D-alanine carboxypeptidase/D-alanyl-D-alanine-endopeptidase (penicillin-binding protein 4)
VTSTAWRFVALLAATAGGAGLGLPASQTADASHTAHQLPATAQELASDLDAVFTDPVFARALVGVRVESLSTGEVLYGRNSDRHVMPASNMKLVTLSVAAERLGWDFRYETRLESAGRISDGTLEGDLIVVGSGDPSIGTADRTASPLFDGWVLALREAGIHLVDGRLIGDDNAFDDEGRGGGWSWDYLTAAYAAPSGALSYNENVAVLRAQPGPADGAPARVTITPPGHGLDLEATVTTAPAGSRGTLSASRALGSRRLVARGRVPLDEDELVRTTAVDNPTLFFVDSLQDTLASHGLRVRDGAWDVDAIDAPIVPGERRVIARHVSPPLSVLAGYLMKTSQNFYAETLLKTIGLAASGAGSESAGRQAVRETLASWGIPGDSVVVYDGSGLSRYDYVTADAIVAILKRMWTNDAHRGPFVATLPVAGYDGTLASRMRDTDLARHVQAKTGTIANVRALSGYLDTESGEKLVFSIIANHFTASSAEVDVVVERALQRLRIAAPSRHPSSSRADGSIPRSGS